MSAYKVIWGQNWSILCVRWRNNYLTSIDIELDCVHKYDSLISYIFVQNYWPWCIERSVRKCLHDRVKQPKWEQWGFISTHHKVNVLILRKRKQIDTHICHQLSNRDYWQYSKKLDFTYRAVFVLKLSSAKMPTHKFGAYFEVCYSPECGERNFPK